MRNTVAVPIFLEGTGLHTGRPCRITFSPAAAGSGIKFIRKDVPSGPYVPASLENVRNAVRGTNLAADGTEVFTVEHVLSACAGLQIDDLDIAIDGPEPPAMDGSALPFAKAMLSAGISETAGEPDFIDISGEVLFSKGDMSYRAVPCKDLLARVVYKHPHPLVVSQELELMITRENYLEQIAPARTFGFKDELEALKKKGLALGGSLENAVVIGENAFLTSPGGLRFRDELVRHKLLDLLGDMMLTGCRLRNVSLEAVCGGHAGNVVFAGMLADIALKRGGI
ncbi:MAG: UDP-3-O-acyl-N-acetylglucosamine deacetylase [bacterium]